VAAGTGATAVASDPSPATPEGALNRVCKRWAAAIAKRQSPEGAFASDVRYKATWLDTGQPLFALTKSRRTCDGVSSDVISAGVRALEQRASGDASVGSRREARLTRGTTTSNAWAMLALEEAAREIGTPAAAADRARNDLLAARNIDGGFRQEPL